jgi:hypothetical protein
MNQAEGETIWSEIHKLLNSLWNKDKFPDQWKESIIVPIYKKGDKTDCSNYLWIPLNFKQNLSNILLSELRNLEAAFSEWSMQRIYND